MGYRRKRKKTDPVTIGFALTLASSRLATKLRLKPEGSKRRKSAGRRQVVEVEKRKWRVFGGDCDHVVIQRDGVLICVDHAPTHLPVKEGNACVHEIAVRRHLTRLLAEKIMQEAA